MARPTTKRRLRDINPDDFGRDVAERVEAHVTSLLPEDGDVATARHVARIVERHLVIVAKKASLLAKYAHDGALDPKQAGDMLFIVCVWLYSCAGQSFDVLEKLDVFPNDDLGIVILAAHARVHLDHNEAVSVRELACLAGVDPDHVRLLARQGEITIEGGVVAPQIAKQWLTARGVIETRDIVAGEG